MQQKRVCVCVFSTALCVHLCFYMCVMVGTKLWGLTGLVGEQQRDKAKGCRLQSHGLVCACASMVSLSRVLCVYEHAFVPACVCVQLHTNVYVCPRECGGVFRGSEVCFGLHLSYLSEIIIHTQTHTHTHAEACVYEHIHTVDSSRMCIFSVYI